MALVSLTVPRRWPHCQPSFSVYDVLKTLYYSPVSGGDLPLPCGCLGQFLYHVSCFLCVCALAPAEFCECCLFYGSHFAFILTFTTVLFVPCGGLKQSPRTFSRCCYFSSIKDCTAFMTLCRRYCVVQYRVYIGFVVTGIFAQFWQISRASAALYFRRYGCCVLYFVKSFPLS